MAYHLFATPFVGEINDKEGAEGGQSLSEGAGALAEGAVPLAPSPPPGLLASV